jgi:hypothetical protein
MSRNAEKATKADGDEGAEDSRFQFSAGDLRLEFSGPAEYVNAQVELFRPALRRALGYADPVPAAGAAAAAGGGAAPHPVAVEDSAGRSALDEFLRRVRTRVGRGALQERILLFIYYLTEVKGRAEVGTEDINFCFDLLGLERPRSLANTLGIMKRNQELLDNGSRRGTYLCTDKGRGAVRGMLMD